jgi:hypothetical protein
MVVNESELNAIRKARADGRDEALRELAFKKFQVQRLSVAAGDAKALASGAESLKTFFDSSYALEDLVRTAYSDSFEATGRAFFNVLRDVMFADAGIEAARELRHPNPEHATLEMRRAAALESLGTALEDLRQ